MKSKQVNKTIQMSFKNDQIIKQNRNIMDTIANANLQIYNFCKYD